MTATLALDPFQLAERLRLPAPTDDQAAVIGAPVEPSLVVAGAGSGKTETMTSRVVWLVASGAVRADGVIGLTFTRKAAAELAQRLRRRLAQVRALGLAPETVDGEPMVSTYHSYASRLVAEHGLRIGVEPSSRLLGEAACWQLAYKVVHSWDGPMDAVDLSPATVVQAIVALSGELADHLVDPEQLDDFTNALVGQVEGLPRKYGGPPDAPLAPMARVLNRQKARVQLLPLLAEYQRLKREREVLDFGDQMRLAAEIASAVPEVGAVERSRYAAVLLDEYQDTGHSQLVLLKGLFGGGHPVTAVGDPCQSIYSWRGASAGTLARFRTEFRTENDQPAPRYALRTSFRNSASVLAVANQLSGPLRRGGLDVDELMPGPNTGAGQVSCAVYETVADETASIVDRVSKLWAVDADRRAAGQPGRSIAVLCRKRTRLEPVAEALRLAGIPVEVVGIGGLLATPEVRDLVATLRVVIQPRAGDALMRLLTGARWRLGARDIDALGRWARVLVRQARGETGQSPVPGELDEVSIVDALDQLPGSEWFSADGYARLKSLAAELRGLRRRAGQPLPDLVADVERTLLLDVEVAARPGRSPSTARSNLDRFADVCAEFVTETGQVTLPAFLAYLEAAEKAERGLEAGEVDVDPDRVQLLTVHGAKGLEWDAVFVPGLVDGFFPASAGTPESAWLTDISQLPFPLRGDRDSLPVLDLTTADTQKDADEAREAFRAACGQRDLTEERRLAYVALTRARSVLVCTGYRWGEGKQPVRPSVFLEEVREACEDGAGTVLEWAKEPSEEHENPLLAEAQTREWPYDPLAARRPAVEEGAELVRGAMAELGVGNARQMADASLQPSLFSMTDMLEPVEAAVADGWRRDVDLLLAERARRARRNDLVVTLPGELSVSRLVALRRDPAELARRLRRPMPYKPAPLARRGTAFHAWLEKRFTADVLLDMDSMPGAADADAEPDSELVALQKAFESSEWAMRTPQAVEVPFQMVVDGTVIRGRMDAVFRDDDGWQVVDWKTGRPPTGKDAEAAAVQLAAYRLAWARLRRVPLERVSAAFHYVRANRTVRPADLLDAAGLAALIASVPVADADT
ncbi:UvrD-helicase domain-containing protein [Fodinicola acaciae]|uniref:UvrD-helicase domain-containing protein n=1 Tax=Fodinicola acaciae TaxID=2681555 RepID=UPI0013D3DBFD|nr:UvrD-helicase domain-containing protein [Fodinicola acaciae]